MPNGLTARVTRGLAAALFLLLCACPTAAAQDGARAVYAVLVDNTGSMRTQFERVKAHARGVVQEVHKSGPVTLYNFRQGATPKDPIEPAPVGDEWGRDADRLMGSVDRIVVEPGQTPLIDAIDSVSERLAARAEAEKGAPVRKVFVLISDGEDRVSRLKAGDLFKRLKQRGVEVYAVGLVSALDREGGLIHKSRQETATDFLRKLTKETGGRLLLPKAKDEEVTAFLQALVAAK